MMSRSERGALGCKTRWSKEPPFEVRFWNRVKLGDMNECWPWQRAVHKRTGYGKCQIKGKHTSAHRVAWEVSNGPIPYGMQVCHKCDNRPCCNPNHLFLGTAKDNADDREFKQRSRPRSGSLSPDQVREIRSITGLTQLEIAKKFNVGQDHISRIRGGKRYGHIK